MMRRESAPFHHPQNRNSILSHHHAWHLPPTSQAQPDHRRCQALALRWVSYGQMCLIEAALAAQPGQTASRHHRPTSPGHRPISRGLASHHRRRCRRGCASLCRSLLARLRSPRHSPRASPRSLRPPHHLTCLGPAILRPPHQLTCLGPAIHHRCQYCRSCHSRRPRWEMRVTLSGPGRPLAQVINCPLPL